MVPVGSVTSRCPQVPTSTTVALKLVSALLICCFFAEALPEGLCKRPLRVEPPFLVVL